MKTKSSLLAITLIFAGIASLPALDLGKIGVKNGKDGGQTFDFAAPPADQSEVFVHLTAPKNLKDIKKVAIVNFLVEFTTVKEAHANAGVAKVTFKLGEPDLARYQKISDALYDQLVAELTAAGMEVIPHESLKAEKRYQDFKKVQHESPWSTSSKGGRSVFVGGKGMPVYLDNPERANALKGMGLSLGMMLGQNPALLEVKLSHELKANLLSVNVVVDFADMKTKKILGSGHVETTYEQFLHGDATRFRFTGIGSPNGPALRLKRGLLAEHSPFLNIKEGEWVPQGSFLDRALATEITKVKTTTMDFDPETYYRNSEQMTKAAQAMFIAEICKARGVTLPASATTLVSQPQ